MAKHSGLVFRGSKDCMWVIHVALTAEVNSDVAVRFCSEAIGSRRVEGRGVGRRCRELLGPDKAP